MSDPYYRSAAWRALRAAALDRDQHRCVVPGCGERATHVDHVVSRRRGGADVLSNLRCLCATHDNQAKESSDGTRRGGGRFVVVGCNPDGTPRDPRHWWRT